MWFLELAKLASTRSKDPSTKTGAVIVRPNKTVVSVGFNGFPQGMPDDEELYKDRDEKYSRIVHCEVNALIFAERQANPDSRLPFCLIPLQQRMRYQTMHHHHLESLRQRSNPFFFDFRDDDGYVCILSRKTIWPSHYPKN